MDLVPYMKMSNDELLRIANAPIPPTLHPNSAALRREEIEIAEKVLKMTAQKRREIIQLAERVRLDMKEFQEAHARLQVSMNYLTEKQRESGF